LVTEVNSNIIHFRLCRVGSLELGIWNLIDIWELMLGIFVVQKLGVNI
jgi:hypothetical protein